MFGKLFGVLIVVAAFLTIGCGKSAGDKPIDDTASTSTETDTDNEDSATSIEDTAPSTGDERELKYPYLIGAGIHDTTGPPAEVMFAGYTDFNQKGAGLLMRTRSRAFVISDGQKRVALVTVDIPLLSSGVHYEAIEKLKERFGDLYTEQNVVISATHTHSAPGAFFKTHLLNLFAGLGFSPANFNAIVNGIYESVVKAHNNLTPARIAYSSGEFSHEEGKRLNRNRSPEAYERNPEADDYLVGDEEHDDTNRTLSQLKFIREDEAEIGLYHWLPHHPNVSGSHLFLINGDVNGLASYRFEKMMDADYQTDNQFVASFNYTNAADSSGNLPEDISVFEAHFPEENLKLDGRDNWIADGTHDYQRMAMRTDTVMTLAEELFNEPGEEVTGPIDYRQMFVYMPHFPIDPEFIEESQIYWDDELGETIDTCKLCDGAAGVSFIAGSMEDGDSGMVSQETNPRTNVTDYSSFDITTIGTDTVANLAAIVLQLITNNKSTHAEMDCQTEKTIAISLEEAKKISPGGKAWNLNQPIQIIRLGSLGIIALPVEVTLMSGRRLKDELSRIMPELNHVMINSTSNGTAMYLTTREEYAAQHYEGGANFMGPYTLNAVQQMLSNLAESFRPDTPLPDYAVGLDAVRDSLIPSPTPKTGGVITDAKPLTKDWGEVRDDAEPSYTISHDPLRPTVARASFVGAHPNNNLQHQATYLEVLRIEETDSGEKETVIARDWDPETRFIWERPGSIATSSVTIEWHIPSDTPPGEYRLVYYGHRKDLDGSIHPITGRSRRFTVENE